LGHSAASPVIVLQSKKAGHCGGSGGIMRSSIASLKLPEEKSKIFPKKIKKHEPNQSMSDQKENINRHLCPPLVPRYYRFEEIEISSPIAQ
jgi:hypothetical protein